MARANIFIRKENEEAWKRIANKSEWVNSTLGAVPVIKSEKVRKELKLPPVIKDPKDVTKTLPAESFNLCKHFANPKFCKHAKPGKPCKEK